MSGTDIFGTVVSDAPTPTNGNGAVGTSPASPTTSSRLGQNNNDPAGGAVRNGVYYYIFLAVLVVLAVIAAALTFRSYRLRRRYRTATQLAIARGDPIPPSWLDDDMWGMGIWRHSPGRNWAAVGTGAGRRERKWVRIPTLFDAIVTPERVPDVEDKGKGVMGDDDEWEGISPVMLQSLLPDEPQVAPETQPAVSLHHAPPPPASAGERLRHAGQGLRRVVGFEQPPVPTAQDFAAHASQPKESDRMPQPDEPVRVAVMIQMPGFPDLAPVDDGEEEPGWRPGMELGLWEGVVSGNSTPTTAPANTTGMGTTEAYAPPSYPPPGGTYPSNSEYASNLYAPPPGPPPQGAAHAPEHAAHPLSDEWYHGSGEAAHSLPPPDTNPYTQRPNGNTVH